MDDILLYRPRNSPKRRGEYVPKPKSTLPELPERVWTIADADVRDFARRSGLSLKDAAKRMNRIASAFHTPEYSAQFQKWVEGQNAHREKRGLPPYTQAQINEFWFGMEANSYGSAASRIKRGV